MTDADRDRLRKLQDRVLAEAARRGIPDDTRVSSDGPAAMTLGALRAMLHPGYEAELRATLDDLRSR